MSFCVLDSSIALSWVLPDEEDPFTDALQERAATHGVAVPGLWLWEVANSLLMVERRGRITSAERQRALLILAKLPIQLDPPATIPVWGEVTNLAAMHKLTVYDASYLELALRLGLPLASLDRALCQAAETRGIEVLGAA
jgi:predicted nucleic acid-binding protein